MVCDEKAARHRQTASKNDGVRQHASYQISKISKIFLAVVSKRTSVSALLNREILDPPCRNHFRMQDQPPLKGLRKGENPESLCDAITALYLAWRIDLLRFAAFRNFGSKTDLEDLLHDVFIELYVHVSNGSTIENPKSWIYKALLHRGIDRCRRAQRLSKYLTSLPTPQNENEGGVEQKVERAEILNRALSQLNVRERDILMLRLLGLTYEEIAEILETSVSLVGVYVTRGLRKLRNPKL